MAELIREIILHMTDPEEIKHFCNNAENAKELCEKDPAIRKHVEKVSPEVTRLSQSDKLRIKETSKLKLPIEIKKKIVEEMVPSEQLAMECYKDTDFSELCKEYKNSFCKDVLRKAKLTKDLSKWNNRYCYLLEELLKIIRIFKRNIVFFKGYDKEKKLSLSLSELVSYMDSLNLCLSLKEEDFNQISNEIINFVQKNSRDSDEEYPKDKLYEATKSGDYKYVFQILKKYFVPVEIKNDLIKVAVSQFDKSNRNYGKIIEFLFMSGATDIFYVIKEIVRTSNTDIFSKVTSGYLTFYTFKECILAENVTLIQSLIEYIQNNWTDTDLKLINIPELISLIYYHKFNYLLPYFLKIASPQDISKAQILYLTQYKEQF